MQQLLCNYSDFFICLALELIIIVIVIVIVVVIVIVIVIPTEVTLKRTDIL